MGRGAAHFHHALRLQPLREGSAARDAQCHREGGVYIPGGLQLLDRRAGVYATHTSTASPSPPPPYQYRPTYLPTYGPNGLSATCLSARPFTPPPRSLAELRGQFAATQGPGPAQRGGGALAPLALRRRAGIAGRIALARAARAACSSPPPRHAPESHSAPSAAAAPRPPLCRAQLSLLSAAGMACALHIYAGLRSAAVAGGHATAPCPSSNRRPVKTLLSEFNAQRMLGKMIKGAHRRLSSDKGPPAAG